MLRNEIDTSCFDLYVVDKQTKESNLLGENIESVEVPKTVYMPINDKWNMNLFSEQCEN